jgi:protoporphyrinogen oxidase
MILGAGMTGLAAGWASGLPVYEAEQSPGGICSSYYMRPGSEDRLPQPSADGETYRFEIGGGHWIFGGDPLVLQFIQSLTPVRRYSRKSAVFFPDKRLAVPYPLQNSLKYLDPQTAQAALCEMADAALRPQPVATMADWLRSSFGKTLCDLFFHPFHELYTSGLCDQIAPQDAYKSPVSLPAAIQGAFNSTPAAGYNTTFVYPKEGLNALASRLAARCDIHYGKRVISIDAQRREVSFGDGTRASYEYLISTLPLNRMMTLAGLKTAARPDPSPSVLVVNIGARRAPECPSDHWVYIPFSKAQFHRVGFYSNVDVSFLPASGCQANDRVSIYVEKSYPEGSKPSPAEMQSLGRSIAQELQEWGWIDGAEVIDPTWIETAYTWSWAGSKWKQEALRLLEEHGIYQVGRYARWTFQGIADSIRDGFVAGSAAKAAPAEAAGA